MADGEKRLAASAQLGRSAFCLVDYDNFRDLRERSKADVEQNVFALRQVIVRAAAMFDPGCNEIRVRLYGGWNDELRRPTTNARWLVDLLFELRGREGNLLFMTELVHSALCRPSEILVGTYRQNPARQKMVDTLMVVDVVHLLRDPLNDVVILSDDDDLIPAVLLSHAELEPARPLHWVRRRVSGLGLNDALLLRHHVRLHQEERNDHHSQRGP